MILQPDAKKDDFLTELQNHLGKGIAALGSVLSNMLESSETNAESNQNRSGLVEAGKMLCAVHNSLSNHRKFLLYPNFNSKILKIAASQVRDTMLFGEDFGEKCKMAKALETSAKELKAPTASSSKNFKGHASRSRWKQQEKRGRKNNYSGNKQAYKTHYKWNRSGKENLSNKRQEWNRRR